MQVLVRCEELQQEGGEREWPTRSCPTSVGRGGAGASFPRQAARGKSDERVFESRMGETEDSRQYWQGEIKRVAELRDDAQKVEDGLRYVVELLATLQARLPETDQSLEELGAMPKSERGTVLKRRRKIIRALYDKVIVWSDGHVS